MLIFRLSGFLSDAAERIILVQIIYRRVMNRFWKFLVYLGYSAIDAQQAKVRTIYLYLLRKVIMKRLLLYHFQTDKKSYTLYNNIQ